MGVQAARWLPEKVFCNYFNGLEDAESANPPFNYRLATDLDLPSWIEDPDFDLANHVHQTTLPGPGSLEQLLEVVSGLHSQMLDRRDGLVAAFRGKAHVTWNSTRCTDECTWNRPLFPSFGYDFTFRQNISTAFANGDDVMLWPGGEKDAYRSWDKRDRAELGGRKGCIRLAIREQVPIVPLATIGGHDTLFVLSEGRGLTKKLGLKERMRVEVAPITLSVPFGITLHLTPFQHISLPAKIRTEFLDPIYLDADPDLENDNEYVDQMHQEVESVIQAGMDHLATKRKFPIFG